VTDLCQDPALDAIYIATPHQFHVDHVTQAGKHVVVEKPMALADCHAMIDAARRAGVWMVVGPGCQSLDRSAGATTICPRVRGSLSGSRGRPPKSARLPTLR
jgi:hypothetical protein